MKTMRRIIVFLIPFLIVLTSCVKSDDNSEIITVDTSNKSERLCEKLGYPDQSVPPEYFWFDELLDDKPDKEENFDNMKIWFDKDSYRINEVIMINIQNLNNKGFEYFPVPYVEILDKSQNEWKRLTYAPDELFYETPIWSWAFSSVKGYGYAKLCYDPFFLCADNVPGEYRFIVFCGKNHVIYSPSVSIG